MELSAFWLIVIVAFVFFLMFFGGTMLTGPTLEVMSFVILAALLAFILASRDLILIAVALFLLWRIIVKRRPARDEYDFDAAAYSQRGT